MGTKSTLQMTWVATLKSEQGPLQIAVAPFPLQDLRSLNGQPWLLDNGILNPAILAQLFGSAAGQFNFVVFDLEALTNLLEQVGTIFLPQAQQSCQGGDCLGWVFAPGQDQASTQRRLQDLIEGVLLWVQTEPQTRSILIHQWVLENQGRGNLKTDIAPNKWSQWAGQARQQGLEIIH
ncbi:MAG TPA: hypothetical protein G4O04_11070 [Anaerolineae bacterium]|nr:hypothetical protein [Anaerolineae bacterium]